MVRVRKVAGLEHLALVAYRELVVDMAGKIEEAVRGKQMGLGMEQEVGEAWKAYDLLTGDEEGVSLCQRSPRLCLALGCMLSHTAGWINWIKLDGCLNEIKISKYWFITSCA